MNKGNFTATDNFPVSTFTYDFLQQMSMLAGRLTALGGTNYILSGCTKDGNNISDGFIVINKEVMPFKGGILKDKITIKEAKLTDNFAGVDYSEAYILRNAEFSDTGEYNWSDFAQVLTNKELEEKINSFKSEAPGFVKKWSGLIERLPSEYKLCNGDILTTNEFPDLAYFYGRENDQSFRIPDLRKRFIVGYDGVEGSDYGEIGNVGGTDFHPLDKSEMPNHDHIYTDDINARGGYPNIEVGFPRLYDASPSDTSAKSTGTGAAFYTTSQGGQPDGATKPHENRPPFYVLAYVIRVKY